MHHSVPQRRAGRCIQRLRARLSTIIMTSTIRRPPQLLPITIVLLFLLRTTSRAPDCVSNLPLEKESLSFASFSFLSALAKGAVSQSPRLASATIPALFSFHADICSSLLATLYSTRLGKGPLPLRGCVCFCVVNNKSASAIV